MTPAPSILALDLSLTRTGWAGLTGSWLAIGTIEEPGSGMDRVERIRSRIEGLAPALDLVVLEGYSFASKGRAIVSLGELGGVIRHWLHVQQIPVVEVPPACRAKYATGKGNAGKDAVLAEAIRRLGYGGHSHDEADALWLLTLTLDRYGIRAPVVPQAHRAVLERITWPKLPSETAPAAASSAPGRREAPGAAPSRGLCLFDGPGAVTTILPARRTN